MRVNPVSTSGASSSDLALNQNRAYSLDGVDKIALEGSSGLNRSNSSFGSYKPAINLEISYEAVELYEKTFEEELNIINGEFN